MNKEERKSYNREQRRYKAEMKKHNDLTPMQKRRRILESGCDWMLSDFLLDDTKRDIDKVFIKWFKLQDWRTQFKVIKLVLKNENEILNGDDYNVWIKYIKYNWISDVFIIYSLWDNRKLLQ